MNKNLRGVMVAACVVYSAMGFAEAPKPLKFEKVHVSSEPYEACTVFDVNNDGVLDIYSGGYWYEGPDFETRHQTWDVPEVNEYHDDFGNYPFDVNGDGRLDVLCGGWFGKKLQWIENPGQAGEQWPVHEVAVVGSVERPCFWDLDGNGVVEIVPNTPGIPQKVVRIVRESGDGEGDSGETWTFEMTELASEPSGHGLGIGDINGDGRGDILFHNGWLEAPEDPFKGDWAWHPEYELFEHASVPILVHDVNGDGLNDLIAGCGHDYGLAWWEQRKVEGSREWVRRDIDMERSQYHDLRLVDLDKDGKDELITGKRWRAHNGKDPGGDDPVGLYYFEINGGEFERVTIDYGKAGEASGAGISFWVGDVDENGWQDIVAPGKEGLFLFKNLGPSQ